MSCREPSPSPCPSAWGRGSGFVYAWRVGSWTWLVYITRACRPFFSSFEVPARRFCCPCQESETLRFPFLTQGNRNTATIRDFCSCFPSSSVRPLYSLMSSMRQVRVRCSSVGRAWIPCSSWGSWWFGGLYSACSARKD